MSANRTNTANAETSGLPALDRVLDNVLPGDNIVWQVSSVSDYVPFVYPFCTGANWLGRKLIYFRFGQHEELLPGGVDVEIHRMSPEVGFKNFIAEIFHVIETAGEGAYYVFDCLSGLAADWYSEQMLGNFFRLTCPYLYDFKTVAYFALLNHYHTALALNAIHGTAQVVLDVYRNKERLHIQPVKVYNRHSPTMYMLHSWEDDEFKPVTRSATITEILANVPQPWIDFTIQRVDVWQRTFREAQEILDDVQAGKRPKQDLAYYVHRLLRVAVTRDNRFIRLAEGYFGLKDLVGIRKRMIGTGLIGGKSLGMLLARAMLEKRDSRWSEMLGPHDSFFVGSDVFYTYLVQNGCRSIIQRQKSLDSLLKNAGEERSKILEGSFPEYIEKQFAEMLDYYGQAPIIVRSSSLLEDAYGNAFSGKYESVFCANQGTPAERLEYFINAVRRVYASTMSEEALTYRDQRGLLEKDEQMALLVQRVSGDMYGDLFFPQVAGVGFSFNPYVWSQEIDPTAGVLRLVFGLGTRAVDRNDDDYTRVVALNAPNKRPEANTGDARRYTQRRVDVLDLKENRLRSRYFEDVAAVDPKLPLDLFATRGPSSVGSDWVLNFGRLFGETGFVQDMRDMLRQLQQAYECPVDVEFTANSLDDGDYRINLLQCRPFQVRIESRIHQPPEDIPSEGTIIKTLGPIIGSSASLQIDRLIYVVPATYSQLAERERYSVARLVGRLTRLEQDPPAKATLLIGPGRWGTTTASLGVPVKFTEINRVTALCEMAIMHEGLTPDVSFGTHFFNDLVELNMPYLVVDPFSSDHAINQAFLETQPNGLSALLPDEWSWEEVIRVIEVPGPNGRQMLLNVDAMKQKALVYLANADG